MTQQITAMTLVDITNTNVRQSNLNNTIEYHQQQNLNVLLQTIGLRTQVMDPTVVIHHNVPLTNLHFGTFYGSEPQTVWSLKFWIERENVWNDGKNEFGLLIEESNNVAITSDLKNTVEFPINVFDTKDNVNLYFFK